MEGLCFSSVWGTNTYAHLLVSPNPELRQRGLGTARLYPEAYLLSPPSVHSLLLQLTRVTLTLTTAAQAWHLHSFLKKTFLNIPQGAWEAIHSTPFLCLSHLENSRQSQAPLMGQRFQPKETQENPRKVGKEAFTVQWLDKCPWICVCLLFKLKKKRETVALNVQARCRLINQTLPFIPFGTSYNYSVTHLFLFLFFFAGFCLATWAFLLSYSFSHIYNAV